MTCSYRFISEHRASFGVALLCRVLGVRRPGFYEWIAATPVRAAHAAAEEELATEIAQVHAEHRNAYGCPRVTVELRRRGWDFTADALGERFVGDITYLPTQEGWLYLATVA